MIRFRNVSKFFDRAKVLESLSFEVNEGEVCALLGLSGSGKTTALKIISGIHLADSGTVEINGKILNKESLSDIRSKIGYVIQDGGLFPHLTAWQNLELVGNEAGWASSKIKSRVDELCELTHLSASLLEKYPRQLSGGQRQRVGLMRALMKNPPILLLDEPLGALDPITRRSLQKELRDLFGRLKKTVVLVTHDLHEASFLAQNILLLSSGSIVQEGRLSDLVENPKNEFVKEFVESQRGMATL